MPCPRCHDARFVCERHPLHSFPHCDEPGMPCPICQPADQRPDITNWESFANLEDLPAERGSIRSVTIEGDPVRYSCEVRTLPRQGLRPGDRVWVEFGAYWEGKTRHPGHWRKCVVLASGVATSPEVHVRLLGLG